MAASINASVASRSWLSGFLLLKSFPDFSTARNLNYQTPPKCRVRSRTGVGNICFPRQALLAHEFRCLRNLSDRQRPRSQIGQIFVSATTDMLFWLRYCCITNLKIDELRELWSLQMFSNRFHDYFHGVCTPSQRLSRGGRFVVTMPVVTGRQSGAHLGS